MIKRIVAAIKREPIAVSIGLFLFIHVMLESQSRAQLMETVGQQLQEARSINHQSRELLEQAQTQMDDTNLLLAGVNQRMGELDDLMQIIGRKIQENDTILRYNNDVVEQNQKDIEKHNRKMEANNAKQRARDEKRRDHCQKAENDWIANNDFRMGNPDHILTRKQRKRHRRECVRLGGSWKS